MVFRTDETSKTEKIQDCLDYNYTTESPFNFLDDPSSSANSFVPISKGDTQNKRVL